MKTYIIRAGYDGPVKIGRAAHVASRVACLQTAHYEELRVVRVIDGDAEKALHKRFAGHRIRREWFHFDADMLTCDVEAFVSDELEEDALVEQYRAALAQVKA